MEKVPEISVIMSTLNPDREKMKKAVDSIIGQTFPSWELLIWDDGSGKDSRAFILSLQEMDPRIHCMRGEENRGLAAGLNACLRAARGSYIARMDDDDISLPDRFRQQIEFLKEHPEYHWVGTTARLFDDSGIWGEAARPEKPQAVDFLHSSPFIHPSVTFRKEILLRTGGYRVTSETSRCEDYELFMRLYAEGYRGYNIQTPLLLYREKSGELSRAWKYCYYEYRVRKEWFPKLKILKPWTFPYLYKPLAVRLVTINPKLAQKIRTGFNRRDHSIGRKRVTSGKESAARKAFYERNLRKIRKLYDASISLEKENAGKLFSESGAAEYLLIPFLTVYVIWTIQSAMRDHVKRLYFLSRDGYPAYLLADYFCRQYGLDLECRYLYCSRYSLRVPMYSENTEEMLEYICRSGIDVTLRKVLSRAGLRTEQMTELLKDPALKKEWKKAHLDAVLSRSDLLKLKTVLGSNLLFLQMVQNRSMEAWPYLEAYFQKEGVLTEDRIGLADSGWVGSTQETIEAVRKRAGIQKPIHGYAQETIEAVQKHAGIQKPIHGYTQETIEAVRKRAGIQKPIHGYYWGLYEIPEKMDKKYYHGFYFEPNTRLLNKSFFTNCLIEGIYNSEEGTVIGYGGEDASPLLNKENPNHVRIHSFNEKVLHYGRIFAGQCSREEWNHLDTGKMKQCLTKSLKTFMWTPTREEAEFYGSLQFSDDLLDNRTKELAPVFSKEEMKENHFLNRFLYAYGIQKKPIHESAWFEATVRRSTSRTLHHRCSYLLYRLLSYIRKSM